MTGVCIGAVVLMLFLVWGVLRTSRMPQTPYQRKQKAWGNPEPPRFRSVLEADKTIGPGWEDAIDVDLRNPR